MRQHWVMDYETLSNCFLGVFQDVKSDDTRVFVISTMQNDLEDFLDFLDHNIQNDEWHVSFNGLGFDGQITEYILRSADQLREMFGGDIAEWIYGKAQNIIETQNTGDFLEFSEKTMQIRQVDVFKLNHWDNPAKRSSLKWIQYSMDWANIKDMPIHHSKEITTQEEVDDIISYCLNDVLSTKQIMQLSKDQIALRKTLTDEYGINLFSASEPRISKELFMHFLSNKTGIKKYDLRQLRTIREKIVVKDIILDYVSFTTAPFQKLLEKFNEAIVYPDETKNAFKYTVQYRGVATDFGLGGIHGARSKSVYESDDDMVIMTSDVVSYYPNLAIRNKWAPAHLPKKEFCEQYEWFFDERRKISKKDIRNYVYKIILNSTYGLSNDKNSFLYDPEFTMRITINGQLSLAMLYEMIMEAIPEAIPLMQNTDGLETIIPRKDQEKYLEICKQWEKMTNLELEHDTYSKIILGDVNNYIAVSSPKQVNYDTILGIRKDNPHYIIKRLGPDSYEYNATKCKGRFEFHNLALHKNKSFLLIPKTLYNYFVHGIDPKEYIKTQTNIFDYCGGKKIKGDWSFNEETITNGLHTITPLQHTIRYYMSNKGSKIIKKNTLDNREIQVEAGKWLQNTFINYVELPFSEYDINYEFYLEKIEKEINSLQPRINQLKLF